MLVSAMVPQASYPWCYPDQDKVWMILGALRLAAQLQCGYRFDLDPRAWGELNATATYVAYP